MQLHLVGAIDFSQSFQSILLPLGMLGATSVPEQFFVISKQNPSIWVPFNNVANSLSSFLADHSLLTSKPEITRLDFLSSIFSCFRRNSIMLIFNNSDIFWDSRWLARWMREGYGVGRIDLEPLENLEPAHTVGNLRWGSSTMLSEWELHELLWSWNRSNVWSSQNIWNWVIVSIALSAILIISSFCESFQVGPDAPAAILNKGEQWLMGFHLAHRQCRMGFAKKFVHRRK